MSELSVPSYVKKFHDLSEREDYKFNLLVNSLESSERGELIGDILTENENNLQHIFRNERDASLLTISFSELTSLPAQTIIDNTPIFETIFDRGLQDKYKEKSERAILKIATVFDRRKAGLSIGFLLDKINDDKLEIKFKTRLMRTLSEIPDSASVFNWDRHDLQKHNFLIPGYIYFYRDINPSKGLRALEYINEANLDALRNHLYHPIEKSVFSLVVMKNDPGRINEIRSRLEILEIDNIIDGYIEKNDQVREIIEGHNIKKRGKILDPFTVVKSIADKGSLAGLIKKKGGVSV